MDFQRIKETQIAILGVCILLGLVISTGILANSLVQFKKYSSQVISVTGAASKPIVANLATWDCSYARRADTMSEAYSALKGDEQIVKAYLKEKGFSEQDINAGQVTTETIYERTANGYNTNTVQGYTLRQTIHVESTNVDLIDEVSRSANELITKGLTFEAMTPQYFYTKLDSLKVEMLGEATKNAKQRAQSMAKSTGNSIGLMRSSQMGVFQITPENSTEVADYGINDTSSKKKKVTAVVSVSFAVD